MDKHYNLENPIFRNYRIVRSCFLCNIPCERPGGKVTPTDVWEWSERTQSSRDTWRADRHIWGHKPFQSYLVNIGKIFPSVWELHFRVFSRIWRLGINFISSFKYSPWFTTVSWKDYIRSIAVKFIIQIWLFKIKNPISIISDHNWK